jgi:signal transduction histidine kinase
MDHGDRERLEGVYRRRDGSAFPVEVHIRRLDLNGDDRFLVISREVTERKERERELSRQNERLEEFASLVSHDLRNPLNVAQSRLELLAEECNNEHAEPAREALERMGRIIEDVLWLAREGKDIGTTESVDLLEATRSAWRMVATGADEAELVVDLSGARAVDADRDRLGQLLENLFRNSVEHAGEGVSVTVGESEGGFFVADDGPGIPEAEREDVFDAGYTTSQDGTGFGLSIVERIAEAHGWEVEVTESPAGGARFEVTGVEFVDE